MFLDKIIDWKEFELFVQKMYQEDSELEVKHDVTLKGKSGAKRQIDVLIIQKNKFHKYITLVECKRWKKKVSRAIVDIVASNVEDLNANKGVIFTTSGYEEGAKEYAQYKNIDIFIVRDLTEDEWGSPGKIIHFYLHFICGNLISMEMPNANFKFLKGMNIEPNINIDIELGKEDERYYLYSEYKEKGVNLSILLGKAIEYSSRAIGEKVPLLAGGKDDVSIIYKSNINIDFKDYKYRYLIFPTGIVEIRTIKLEQDTQIIQTLMHVDRSENLDIALIVENYIFNQRHTIVKKKNDEKFSVLDNTNYVESEDNDTLKNNSIMKIYTKHTCKINYKDNGHNWKTNNINIKVNDILK